MRFAGRISGWNDEKGYGFVAPHDGGERAFVHVKAFQSGSRRPVDGDLVSYETSRDAKGRTNAVNVRFAGQRIEQHRPHRRIPRAVLGALSLLAILCGTLLGAVPSLVLVVYLALSCLSYIFYTLDKASAERGAFRTPESTLHLVDILGGWPGALVAQQQMRHKTVKASFQWVFWITVLANIAACIVLVRGGYAGSLSAALFG